MKKRFFSLILILALAVTFLAGCAEDNPEPVEENPNTGVENEGDVNFAVVFGIGGLGDNGYNDEVFQGVEMAAEELGATYDYVEPRDISDVETQLRAFADSEEYDLIMAVSNEQGDILKMVAEDYPDQKFSMLDTPVDGYDNVSSVSAAYPDQHFLSGVLAGIATQDERFPLSDPDNNVLGFTIAMDNPTSRGQASGFLAGAKYINPEVEILTNFIGSFNDPATAKELALMMYERGADIVSANAGASTQGVFYAAEEQDKYAIGTSLNMIDPDRSLAISLKRSWLFVMEEVEHIKNGTWEAGSTVLGIPEGVCDYDTTGLNIEIPEDVVEILDDIRNKISNGELTLPSDLDQVDEWASQNQYY